MAAARDYLPGHSRATAVRRDPYFMGVPMGEAIWSAAEAAHADLLDGPDKRLLDLLAARLR